MHRITCTVSCSCRTKQNDQGLTAMQTIPYTNVSRKGQNWVWKYCTHTIQHVQNHVHPKWEQVDIKLTRLMVKYTLLYILLILYANRSVGVDIDCQVRPLNGATAATVGTDRRCTYAPGTPLQNTWQIDTTPIRPIISRHICNLSLVSTGYQAAPPRCPVTLDRKYQRNRHRQTRYSKPIWSTQLLSHDTNGRYPRGLVRTTLIIWRKKKCSGHPTIGTHNITPSLHLIFTQV